ncbi:hypothetical protein C2S52_017454 [Perilla frutescens var. hirtella]|nr:hypothetical protein C2S52_017454 [Perilla frutescens var. hirtella]
MSLLPNTRLECGSKYHFFRPVWALHIWACEAIPDLAGQIAQCVYPHALPRCLRWFLVQSSIDDFDAFFKAGFEHSCQQTLQVEPNEEQSDYWTSIQSPNALGVRFQPPRCKRREDNENRHQEKTSSSLHRWEKREAHFISKVKNEFLPDLKDFIKVEMKHMIRAVWPGQDIPGRRSLQIEETPTPMNIDEFLTTAQPLQVLFPPDLKAQYELDVDTFSRDIQDHVHKDVEFGPVQEMDHAPHTVIEVEEPHKV